MSDDEDVGGGDDASAPASAVRRAKEGDADEGVAGDRTNGFVGRGVRVVDIVDIVVVVVGDEIYVFGEVRVRPAVLRMSRSRLRGRNSERYGFQTERARDGGDEFSLCRVGVEEDDGV